MLARCFEEAGIATTGIVMVKEHAQRTKPPRMLWVPYPFGNALGRPNDPQLQHQILKAAFHLLKAQSGPVLEEFPDDTIPQPLLQASEAPRSNTANGLNPADELTALRPYYERWVTHNGRTAVGGSGIPQRRFRGIIRFLENYADNPDADTPDRPSSVTIPQFIRYCVDDLKAFYYEARMEQRPNASDSEIHQWYWSETAISALILRLAETMNRSDDPAVKAIPYGLAR